MEKKNKWMIIVISILGLLVIGLTSYIVYDKISDNKDNNDIENIDNNTDTLLSWNDYLLSCHILDANITRLRSKDLGDDKDVNIVLPLSMNNLRDLLSNFNDSKLRKVWSEGKGGPDRDTLSISYEINDKKYEFKIWNGAIIVDQTDNKLKDILNNESIIQENTEYENIEGAFYYYFIDDYSDTIYDKYFY